jgi:hypothetical protein
MPIKTNEYANRIWTDERYRPEVTECEERESDGASRLGGWLVPRDLKANPDLKEVPFRITLPAGLQGFDLHQPMAAMFNRLRAGESLLEGLNFAPDPPPVAVPAEINWGAVGWVIGLSLAGIGLSRAFSSR